MSGHTKNYDALIGRLKTINECDALIKNAIRLKNDSVVKKTKLRKVHIKAQEYQSTENLNKLDLDIIKAIYAYEEALELKNNRKTRAGFTWKSVRNNGFVGMVEKAVTQSNETSGFKYLSEIGMLELSYEQVVLDHKEHFSEQAVQLATEKLHALYSC